MKPRTHRGLGGVVSSAAAGMLSLIAGIVLLPIVLSTVGSAQYGVWLLLSVVATYFNYADLGVGAAIVHFGSRSRGGDQKHSLTEYLSAGLLWNLAAVVVISPVYVAIAMFYSNSSGSEAGLSAAQTSGLTVLGAVMLAGLLLKPFGSALTGAGLLPVERSNRIWGVIVRVIGTVVACYVFDDILAVAIAEVLGVLVPSVLSTVITFKRRIARIKWTRSTPGTLRYMLSYSARSFAINATGALLLQAGTIIVAIVATPSHVTYFNAAFRVYSSVRQIMAWVTDPFRPALSRLYFAQREVAERIIYAILFATLTSAVVGCLFLSVGAFDIVQYWLGENVPTDEVAITIVVLLTGLVLNAIHIPMIPAGDAAGRPGAFFVIQCVWLVLFVGLGLVLGHNFGIVGVALGLTLPLLLVEPMYLLKARGVMGLDIRFWITRVAVPAATVGLCGAGGAGLYEAVAMIAAFPHLSIWTAASSLLGSALGLFLLRRWLPLQQVRDALKVEL
jgi:O-antigen/teichoic acid export membrane protein